MPTHSSPSPAGASLYTRGGRPPLLGTGGDYLRLLLLACLLFCLLPTRRGHAQAGVLDASFNPGSGPNDAVNALALQMNGKVILGGSFTQVNGTARQGVARLNADGSLDAGFNPVLPFSVNRVVHSLAVQPDGKVILQNSYTAFGAPVSNLMRLNADGSTDSGFNTVALSSGDNAYGLAVQANGKIVLGGDFSSVNGVTRRGLARLNADGSLDTGFNPSLFGINRKVYSLVQQADGKLVFFSRFSVFNVAAGDITRLFDDGTVDTSFKSPNSFDADNTVNALATEVNGKIVLGGTFTQINGVARQGVARLNADGSLDPSFNTSLLGTGRTVDAVAVQADAKVVFHQRYFFLGQSPNFLTRLNPDGSVDNNFSALALPGTNAVNDLAVQTDGKVLLGGAFSLTSGMTRNNVARLNADTLPAGVSVVGSPEQGGFLVSRTDIQDTVLVQYHNGGSAVRGVDYTQFPGTLVLGAGQARVLIPVTVLPGANRNHKVKVFLDAVLPTGIPTNVGAYQIGKTQSKVFLSDLP